jgi:hypothetical protein
MCPNVLKIACAVVALTATACGNRMKPLDNANSEASATCAWPTYLDPDASLPGNESGLCTAHRYLFLCSAGNLLGYCISDFSDAGESPECAELGPGRSCKSACDEDEYVTLCQSFSAAPPNSSCRKVDGNPEQAYFCCACVYAGL